jgi:hypothetical protein
MTPERDCQEIRELLPELALGIAEGDDRGRALDHLADCPDCRRRLTELSETADELLLLAPTEEPTGGFETRLLERLQPRAPRSRRRVLRLLTPAVAAALAVGLTLVLAYRDQREVADRYQQTLTEVEGKYLAGERLKAPGGRYVGKVYGYEGEPSWVLVTTDEGELPDGRYDLELVRADGVRVRLGDFAVSEGAGSGGEAIPLHFHEVTQVRLIGPGRGAVYEASFGTD